MSVNKIAIYLPQYHAIPENDEAWGQGFTEWTNVKKAKALFEGHYQPHVPGEGVGYYDLKDPNILVRQAAMAKEYGIHGFAYYHYWFNGKRLLNEPLDNMIKTGNPDFPFCFIWANENWTKRWDGADQEMIIKQDYSFDDDLKHIHFLCENIFNDRRYIAIDGKPLFLVYRTELFPDIKKTASIWRDEVIKYGFKGIYLVRVESFEKNVDPSEINFDGAMEFAPDMSCKGKQNIDYGRIAVIDYPSTIFNMIIKQKPYQYFHCVFPGWDNTPRRIGLPSIVFINNYLEVFKFFLETQLGSTIEKFRNNDEQIIFINAWNEWGEGCHIEPDKKNGTGFLKACKDARPKARDEFELFCLEQLSILKENHEKATYDLELLNKKYTHLLNSPYYKVGKKISIGYRSIRDFFTLTNRLKK